MPLTEKQAKGWKLELQDTERNPEVSKTGYRVFLQLPMECGHCVANLQTDPNKPDGCSICEEMRDLKELAKKAPLLGTRDDDEDFT